LPSLAPIPLGDEERWFSRRPRALIAVSPQAFLWRHTDGLDVRRA